MVDKSQENINEVVNDGLPEKESDDVPLISLQPPKKKRKQTWSINALKKLLKF